MRLTTKRYLKLFSVGIGLLCSGLLCSCSPSASPSQQLYAEAVRAEGSGSIMDARAKYVEITQHYPTSPEARLALDRIFAIDNRRSSHMQEMQSFESQELLRKQLETQRLQLMEQQERDMEQQRARVAPSP